MSIKSISRKEFISISQDASIKEVAGIMASRNVGSVVVVEDGKPVWILTDRDIVVRLVNKGINPSEVKVSELMTKVPICLQEDLGILEALEIVKQKGVRRYPVVDKDGKMTGIVSLDDIVYLIGKEMCDISNIIVKASPNLWKSLYW